MAKQRPQILVECWKSRNNGWEKLTKDERKEILDQILGGVGGLVEDGLELVGFFLNDPDEGNYRMDWTFVAVWKLPSKALLDKMLPMVEQLGIWFEVMDEQRVWGEILTVEDGNRVLLDWPNESKPADSGSDTLTGTIKKLSDRIEELAAKIDKKCK